MKTDGFASFHPAVCLVFFAFTLSLSVTVLHPVCLVVSLSCAAAWAVLLDRARARGFILKAVLPTTLLAAALNPLFNHRGQTILAYFPGGNPLTLESLVYGAAAALMLAAALLWFFCLNRIISAEKLTCLFGKTSPSLALLFAMTMRFVPRFSAKFREVSAAQTAFRGVPEGERLLPKIRRGTRVISITVTWALENAVVTADSMRGRAYGLGGRTAFSLYRFTVRDGCLLALTVLFGGTAALSAAAALSWRYFPEFDAALSGVAAWAGISAYLCLCASPLIIDALEVRRWKRYESKI